jgi:hypothetical protein
MIITCIILLLWSLGIVVLMMLPSFLSGRRAGQGKELSHHDLRLLGDVGWVVVLWPLLMVIAIIFGPFAIIFYGIGKLLFKLGKLSA